MKYDNRKTFVLVIFAIIIFGILILFLNYDSQENNINDKPGNLVELVEDPSKFYTVSSCITKYMKYLSSNDNEKIYTLLSPSYIKKNSITVDNVFDYIKPYDGEYNQNTIRMYSEPVNNYITKYYVKYIINESSIDYITEDIVQYIIVVLNERELSFSIIPYDGEMFKNE